ncbi:hypothetical protein AKJ16_DCAP07178 [Drosera capensis]
MSIFSSWCREILTVTSFDSTVSTNLVIVITKSYLRRYLISPLLRIRKFFRGLKMAMSSLKAQTDEIVAIVIIG